MKQKVNVRFAPSPTGPLHIGGVRTALFNYLFAKQNQGTFILRIEDTDQARYVEGAEKYIIDALNWCQIPYDEGPEKEGSRGPYRQSERRGIYKKYADLLVSQGKAYYAFDSNEELEFHRRDHEKKGKTFIYNYHNRLKLKNALSLSEEEVEQRLASESAYVIRFKTPENKTVVCNDIVRGVVSVNTNTLDDKVLFKSDGMPTYHLANVVDDYLMEISHVIRGEEWLPSLALHYLLYESFGWTPPQFAHLPLILKPKGRGKLSKRDGDKMGFPVFPMQWKDQQTNEISSGFKEEGYLPEALYNFLAFLGWNPGTEQEIFDMQSLVRSFDLGQVNRSGARFDPEKAKWFNQQHLIAKDDLSLAKRFKESREELKNTPLDLLIEVVKVIKERASFVNDFWGLSHFFFELPSSYNPKALKKVWKPHTKAIIDELMMLIQNLSFKNPTTIQEALKNWIKNKELSFGAVMMPLRVALAGDLKGPDLFFIMYVVGKENSIKRLKNLLIFMEWV